MAADQLSRSFYVLPGHANVVRFERGVQEDRALLPIPDDVDVWPVTPLIARVNDDTEAFDLNARQLDTNLRSVGWSNRPPGCPTQPVARAGCALIAATLVDQLPNRESFQFGTG